MTREFEIRQDVPLDATPEQVWEAVATGPGITSWLMPYEVEPRAGGRVTVELGGEREDSTVTAWEPPYRFAFRGPAAEDGSVEAMEFLIESRDGGATVLRFVHSGLASPDWGDEFEAQSAAGWDMYLHTLVQYLTHFTGRTATFVYGESPKTSDPAGPLAVVRRALGVPDTVAAGDRVRVDPAGLPPIDGVADYATPDMLGIRTTDALYRFHGHPETVRAGHHLFAPVQKAEKAWQDWLNQAIS
ncbi:SRPBCC domain-containing protein [Polymorphospora sp. NPDC050346]|uniref:SRPBCC domain-containing protein n=1 Tax=Polymorphospora sp. NPDC050346 TaxID=3155780 RepID=UPI0033CE0221